MRYIALEDIKAADGESEDYYKKDELIARLPQMKQALRAVWPSPWKILCERKGDCGRLCAGREIREIDLTYVDQETAEVTWNGDWQNNRQKAEVSVPEETKRILTGYWRGAVFALSAKEDITNKDGDVVLEREP